MRKIIGLTGVKTSGKSTAFNMIKELVPGAREIQLAKKLKDVCSQVFDIPRNYFDDQSKKEATLDNLIYLDRKNISAVIEAFGFEPLYDSHVRPHVGAILESPRRVAQYVGTEVLRSLSEDIHCIGAIMGIPADGVFVVTDMRFLNEYEFFLNQSKSIVKAKFLPIYIQSNRAEAALGKEIHPSELQVFEVAKKCKRLENNQSLQELKANLTNLINEFIED